MNLLYNNFIKQFKLKRTMKLIAVLFSMLGLTQCKSVKFDTQPPFKIQSAHAIRMVGGMPGNSSIQLKIAYTSNDEVSFQELFYQNKKTKVFTGAEKKQKLVTGTFNTSTVNDKNDLILHNDPTRELKNKAPEEKFPFQLKENEAVISYVKNNKTYYFKIEDIKNKKVFMP
ncbi:hypothetical protein WH52_04780 [Tenacibaculum holothuriorum]|uniref:Uncharacterized protein n=2 Tax=Tenacibaculum holothuriorum TaxID=1635173 RepID=A0A1Y2PG48_9FLAO|nr:hypothetical protein WH52_04780 [Tenacibaculum holothuriorum]